MKHHTSGSDSERSTSASSLAGRWAAPVTAPRGPRRPWVTWLMLLCLGGLVIGGAGCSRKARATRYFESAEKDLKAEKWSVAEIEYLNVIKLQPNHPLAWQRLGLLYEKEGRYQRAAMFLLRARELNTNDLTVRLKLGSIYKSAGKFKEAHEEAAFVLKQTPDSDEGLVLFADTAVDQKTIEATQKYLESLQTRAGQQAGYRLAMGVLCLRRKDLAGADRWFQQALAANPQSSMAYVALGNLRWMQNDLTGAEQAYRKAAEVSPPVSVDRLRLVDFKLRTGDLPQAKSILEELTKKAPDFIFPLSYLAQLAFAEKKYDDCQLLIEKIVKLDPENFEALSLRARLQISKGEFTKAIQELNQLDQKYPQVPAIQYQLAVAHLMNQNIDRAQECLRETIKFDPNHTEAILLSSELNLRRGNSSAAISLLTDLAQKRPKLPQAQMALANAYRLTGQLDNALAAYGRVSELAPKDIQAPFLSGLILRVQNKTAEARRAFDKVLTLSPDNLQAVAQLMELDLAAKDYPAAMQRVQEQVKRLPKEPAPLILEARVWLAQNDVAQCEAALLKAIELNPDYSDAYLILARLYANSNRMPQALTRLDELLKKQTNSVNGLMLAGMIHSATKDYVKARDAYERLLKVNPRFEPALNNLACLYAEQFKDLTNAFKMASQARALRPGDPASADTLGWIQYQRGDYAQALALVQESASKVPANSEIQYHLGMINYALGRDQEAKTALQLALKLGQEFSGKERIPPVLAILEVDPQSADPQAVAMLEQWRTTHPEDSIVFERLAAIYEKKNEPQKAVDLYREGLAKDKKNFRLMLKLAQLYADRLHQPAKAMDALREIREVIPADPQMACELGRLFSRLGDYPSALKLLLDGARQLPSDPVVSCDLAKVYYQVGRVDQADTQFQIALRMDNQFAGADQASQMVSLIALGRNPELAEKSIGLIDTALKSDTNNIAAMMAMAGVHSRRGEPAEVRKTYEKVLAINPLFFPATRALALFYAQDPAQDQQAYPLALKARESFPQDPDLAKALGLIVYRRSQYTQSLQFLRESVQKLNKDPEVYYYLGMSQYRLNDKVEATNNLQKALGFNLKSPLAEEAKRLLTTLK